MLDKGQSVYIHSNNSMKTSKPSRPAVIAPLPCACSNLRRAARAVTQMYAKQLRATGLEPTQLTLLMALDLSGEITQGSLGEMHALDSTTLTRSLGRLREQGWAVNRPGQDRRERLWRLTAAGRRELESARPLWERAQKQLRKKLGREDWNRLDALLSRVTAAAEAG